MKENVNKSVQQTYVYMVMCEDESIYTGIARDVKARMKEHFYKTGKGAKYTRSRGVKRILMVWEAKSYSSAARLEYAIKRITRKNKLFLIEHPQTGLLSQFPQLEEEIYVPRQEYVMKITELLEDKVIDKEERV